MDRGDSFPDEPCLILQGINTMGHSIKQGHLVEQGHLVK